MRNTCALLLTLLVTTGAFADPGVKEVRVTQSQATGGAVLQGQVVLQSAATTENVWVELQADESVHVPMAVRVPQGCDSATFTLSTDPVTHEQTVSVRATVRGVGPACAVRLQPEMAASR